MSLRKVVSLFCDNNGSGYDNRAEELAHYRENAGDVTLELIEAAEEVLNCPENASAEEMSRLTDRLERATEAKQSRNEQQRSF